MSDEKRQGGRTQGEVLTEERIKVRKPNMYRVVLLNDDYTPMEFVVWVLQVVFHRSRADSTRLMLEVHHTGRGVAGVFTHDVARTKALQVENLAKRHEHPLQCQIEALRSE